jgi:hypothetical protein
VRAAVDDLAGVDEQDLVGALDRRDAVGDHDRRPVAHQPVERLLDQVVGPGVDARGRLVQDQDARVDQDRARDRDALALPAREAGAALAVIVS